MLLVVEILEQRFSRPHQDVSLLLGLLVQERGRWAHMHPTGETLPAVRHDEQGLELIDRRHPNLNCGASQ